MEPARTEFERGIMSILRGVLLEVRLLCRQGYAAQAGSLADAAHNIPVKVVEGTLDLPRLLAGFEEYEAAYRGKPSGDPSGRPPLRNYPEDLRAIIKNLGDD